MQELNVVVDLSHHNGVVDFKKAKASGILAIIHKATQGADYIDPKYADNLEKAKAAGLLWGAYHFGTGGDGVTQAKHFLSVTKSEPWPLLVLDFENNTQGQSMTLEEAHAFVTHIHEVTGRWPGLYSGNYVKELLKNNKDAVLSKCWFWLSQYGPTAVVPVNWDKWTLWQYTDGTTGSAPHSVDGIGSCDRDKFNGTGDELVKFWTADA